MNKRKEGVLWDIKKVADYLGISEKLARDLLRDKELSGMYLDDAEKV